MGATNPVATAEASVCAEGSKELLLFLQRAIGFKGKNTHSQGGGKIRDRSEDSQREWADGFESKETCYSDCAQVFYNEW